MKAPFSPYLNALAPKMKKLAALLGESFEYVSILSTDSVGFSASIYRSDRKITGKTMTTERGNVVRVWRNGQYSEYAFNEIPGTIEALAEEIVCGLECQFEILRLTGTKAYDTPILPDEPLELFEEKETQQLPEQVDMKVLVETFTALSDRGMQIIPRVMDCGVSGASTHISKMFVTKNRFLRQSYVYTEGVCWAVSSNEEDDNKDVYQGVSGCGGPEILEGLKEAMERMPKLMEQMLSSEEIEPGEYEIITDPEISGLIAHEAFGHGVEMDMFVKHRALGADYIGKRVGSELCTMHEGALCDNSVTAYVFDDEGVLAGDVIEIDRGILKTGICDALAALRLGVQPTGNGKRENFAHKVYTRMTNTIFDSGENTLEEMIASVRFGYLLEGEDSGMEDPKHWGIQCIVCRGYEIKDGALTGRVVSPVVMTGYVPDLLGSISMASRDRGVMGNGGCGKGHKEWVKVAAGGPYLKMKARLG